MNIYFLKYNNYFNRTFRRENSLADYLAYEVGRTIDVKLFTPGDGVNTSVVVNVDLKAAGMSPDYAIVQDDQGNIESRWFVMECRQLRVNQFKVDLRRDLVVENIGSLEACDRFWCDRGLVEDSNNLVLQPENISVNRIKKSETLIKDNTGVAWLVGYLNRNYTGGTFEGDVNITPFKTYNTLEEFEYHNYIDNWFNAYTSNESTWFTLYWNKTAYLNKWIRSWDIKSKSITQNSDWKSTDFLGYRTQINGVDGDFPTLEAIKTTFGTNTWLQDIKDRFGIKSLEETNSFISYDDVTIKVADTYYKIHIKDDPHNYEETLNRLEATDNAPTIKALCESLNGSLIPTPMNRPVYTFHTSGTRYKIELEELPTNAGFSFTIPADRPKLDDAPYDMFAIPYGQYDNSGNKQIAMKAVSTMMAKLNVDNNSQLYDIQLLPFSPTLSTTTTDIKNASEQVIGKIYWATSSTFSKTILLDTPIGVENPKLNSITDLYRLVSPNYSGQFEFTAAANGGINGFKVDATYLPLNPYIRVAPLFGRLYGNEFSDARGLICGGDFSLPVVNSAWVSYQQNNKTYQAVFDRSIANLEFTNNIGRQLDRIGAVVGTIQGAAQGGAAGAIKGPWGAAAGAVVGGIASGISGIADLSLNEQIRQEQLSYIKDQQRLNLAAIQAQPYSLSKTTAFTANNKIFPILEFYTCSEKEKEAVVAYLVNNSFNIGAVIPFKSILTTTWASNNKTARKWIQGHPIEINSNEDYHYTAELGRELAQGYYFEYWEEN